MSVDLRLRHDRLLREQAVELFERGIGYGLTAKRLGVPAEAVRGPVRKLLTVCLCGCCPGRLV